MKTLLILLLATAQICFGEGTLSPVRDQKGFIGGTFTGNGSGITNIPPEPKFFALKYNSPITGVPITTDATPLRMTNFEASASSVFTLARTNGYVTNKVGDGWFSLYYNIALYTATADSLGLEIYTNGVALAGSYSSSYSDGSGATMLSGNATVYLVTNSLIELRAQGTGAKLALSGEFGGHPIK
jgi:hypothetical protein